ncbi:hypothetical protein ACET3Z_013632 [Daucus carota]
MNTTESINSGVAAPEIDEIRSEIDDDERENEDIDNEFGELNSQDGEEDDEEAELSPKLAEGFYEIETVRRKRVRKGQVQYLIKWRGWPETANTWEPYENLVSCFDVIEAFEEGLRSGKHRSRKRKRRSTGLVPQGKKKTQGTPGASTSSPVTAGKVKFDEGNFIIPFVGDVSHEDGGWSEMGGIINDDAIGQGNGNGSVGIPPHVEEEKDGYEKDVNVGESTGTQLTNRGSGLLDINNLESQICFENGHQRDDSEGLDQANVRLRKRRKAASVKRFSQEQTAQPALITNYAAIDQGNGKKSVDIRQQVDEGRNHYDMDVNHGEYAGTPLINWSSNRVSVDILELKTSEAVCFENGHQKFDGVGQVQANVRLRKRRKVASLERFSPEQTPQTTRVTSYATIEQGNGNESVDIPLQVEEGRDNYEMDVNPGEYAGTTLINWGSGRIGVDVLESNTSETICFEKGHQKVNGEGLVQANGRLRNRRKATSVKRFSQEQTPRVTYYAAIGQGNGNESIDIPLQVEGKDHYEMDVNPGGYAGTPVINGDSSRMAADILESRTSEAFFFENGHQKVDGEGLVQANGRLRNRRKAASVKRFNQEQTPCVTNYAAQDLTTKNTRAGGIAGQNWDKNSVHRSTSDNSADTFSITEIIKPISFSSSGSIADILVTFMAKRSDGKEVMVDNKYLKANYPLLLINYYEQHLNYNATAGPDRSGREYLTG